MKFISRKYIWLCMLLFSVLYPNLIVISNGYENAYIFPIKKAAFVLFSFLLFLVPALFIDLRKYLFFSSPFVLLAPVEFFYRRQFGAELSVGVIGAIIDTDINEAYEFLEGIGLLLLLPVVLLAVYLWILKNKLDKDIGFSLRQRFVFAFIPITFLGLLSVKDMVIAKENKLGEAYDDLALTLNKTYPFGTTTKIVKAFGERRKLENYQYEIKDFTFHAKKKDNLREREVYILIIGESARYENWGINGYHRNTSPNLSKMEDIVSYSDFVSSGTLTRDSVPLMITRGTAEEFERTYREKSILSAFKESGFKVYWLSNQAKYSEYDTSVTIHAMEADEAIFLNNDSKQRVISDEELRPMLSEILKREEKRQFIVLHTMGNHYNYSYRYPERFDLYKPSLRETGNVYTGGTDKKEIVVNSYDNSILYVDFFISSMINMVENTQAVGSVIYVSDHGENLFDDERSYFRHGYPTPSRYEVHVPLFIWVSENYKSAYPDKSSNIAANKDKKLNFDNLFYSILDIANIRYDGEDLTKSFANTVLEEDKRKVFTASGEIVEYGGLY